MAEQVLGLPLPGDVLGRLEGIAPSARRRRRVLGEIASRRAMCSAESGSPSEQLMISRDTWSMKARRSPEGEK